MGAQLHVGFNECEISDQQVAGSTLHTIRHHGQYDAIGNAFATWLNNNREAAMKLTTQFTNIVCLIAYQFHSKGHHFLDSYQENYDKLCGKIKGDSAPLRATWAQISNVALHAIPPIILDKFWEYSVQTSRCAPSLQLRWEVPAAGNVAIYTIPGWKDI